MGTKNNPSEFDCYEKAEPDEPMFVLLARDVLAPALVMEWAQLYQRRPNFDPNKVLEAQRCAVDMNEWRKENHDGRRTKEEDTPPTQSESET